MVANVNILAKKQEIIDEVKAKVQEATTVVLFDYRGLTDNESKELRVKLRDTGADYKVYKNTLMARAFNDLNIDVNTSLEGPSAFAYGNDAIAPIKVLTDFAKTHPALVLKVGIVDGELTSQAELAELAKIPSREGLLTMLAGALIGIPRDLSISLDLYAKQKEEN
ncbi:50S ribosomal protein L10 [bacterium]|jgi:ribosomal protein L10|nr:50S ribosomal protein L10 [bacterium]